MPFSFPALTSGLARVLAARKEGQAEAELADRQRQFDELRRRIAEQELARPTIESAKGTVNDLRNRGAFYEAGSRGAEVGSYTPGVDYSSIVDAMVRSSLAEEESGPVRGTVVRSGNRNVLTDPTSGEIITEYDPIPTTPRAEPGPRTGLTIVNGRRLLVDLNTGETIRDLGVAPSGTEDPVEAYLRTLLEGEGGVTPGEGAPPPTVGGGTAVAGEPEPEVDPADLLRRINDAYRAGELTQEQHADLVERHRAKYGG